MIKTVAEANVSLVNDAVLVQEVLTLSLPEMRVSVTSDSQQLLDELRVYFAYWLDAGAQHTDDLGIDQNEHCQSGVNTPTVNVIAIERPPVDIDVEWVNWSREAGKVGRKDAYADIAGGRLIRKVRTGMVFLQSGSKRIAAGPCLENCNQVINFIGNQYMNYLQQQDWKICHAAALARGDQALAIAGLSGGGKSTLMLHMLDDPSFNFVTNDRLFIKVDGEAVSARGIPKLPRINPGTIINNHHLRSILSAEECAHFTALPVEELWHVERKYDVDIEKAYGDGRISRQATLAHFIVLNWSRTAHEETRIVPFDIASKPELLGAIMKSSGPFYQYPDGHFYQDNTPFDRVAYTDILSKVKMIEVSGKIDFEKLKQFCLEKLC